MIIQVAGPVGEMVPTSFVDLPSQNSPVEAKLEAFQKPTLTAHKAFCGRLDGTNRYAVGCEDQRVFQRASVRVVMRD
jgi:hypothetical protein